MGAAERRALHFCLTSNLSDMLVDLDLLKHNESACSLDDPALSVRVDIFICGTGKAVANAYAWRSGILDVTA